MLSNEEVIAILGEASRGCITFNRKFKEACDRGKMAILAQMREVAVIRGGKDREVKCQKIKR